MASTATLELLVKAQDQASAELKKVSAAVESVGQAGKVSASGLQAASAASTQHATAVKQVTAESQNASRETARFSQSVAGFRANLYETGPAIQQLIGGMLGIAPVAAAAAAAISFEDASVKLQNFAGLSTGQTKEVSEAILAMGRDSEFSAHQMIEALTPVAGRLETVTGESLTAAQATEVLRAATDLADASMTGLKESTSALVNVMLAYQIPLSGAAHVSDQLFNTTKITGIGIDQLATTVDRLRDKLGSSAPPLDEMGALLAELSSQGLSGSRGLLVVASSIESLTSGSAAVNQTLRDLGVGVFDSQGKFIGLRNVIAELQPVFARMTEAERNTAASALFGANAAGILQNVIAGGTTTFDKFTERVNEAGTAQRAAAADAETISEQFDILKNDLESIAIGFGDKLLPAVTDFVAVLHPLLDAVANNQVAMTTLSVVLGGALVVGLAAVTAGVIGLSAAFLKSGFELIIGTLNSIAAALGLTTGASASAAVAEEALAVAEGEVAAAATAETAAFGALTAVKTAQLTLDEALIASEAGVQLGFVGMEAGAASMAASMDTLAVSEVAASGGLAGLAAGALAAAPAIAGIAVVVGTVAFAVYELNQHGMFEKDGGFAQLKFNLEALSGKLKDAADNVSLLKDKINELPTGPIDRVAEAFGHVKDALEDIPGSKWIGLLGSGLSPAGGFQALAEGVKLATTDFGNGPSEADKTLKNPRFTNLGLDLNELDLGNKKLAEMDAALNQVGSSAGALPKVFDDIGAAVNDALKGFNQLDPITEALKVQHAVLSSERDVLVASGQATDDFDARINGLNNALQQQQEAINAAKGIVSLYTVELNQAGLSIDDAHDKGVKLQEALDSLTAPEKIHLAMELPFDDINKMNEILAAFAETHDINLALRIANPEVLNNLIAGIELRGGFGPFTPEEEAALAAVKAPQVAQDKNNLGLGTGGSPSTPGFTSGSGGGVSSKADEAANQLRLLDEAFQNFSNATGQGILDFLALLKVSQDKDALDKKMTQTFVNYKAAVILANDATAQSEEVFTKLAEDRLSLVERQAAAATTLRVREIEAVDAAYQMQNALVTIAELFARVGETAGNLEIAKGQLDEFRNALDNLLSRPTKEGAQLQLQIDTLQRQADLLIRGGADASRVANQGKAGSPQPTSGDKQLKAIEDHIKALSQEKKIRQDNIDILRDQNLLQDKTLLSDGQLLQQDQLLVIAMNQASDSVNKWGGAVFFQTLATINLANAANEAAAALRGTGGASGTLAEQLVAAYNAFHPNAPIQLATGVRDFGGGVAQLHQDELVRLPRGADVVPAQASREIVNRVFNNREAISSAVNNSEVTNNRLREVASTREVLSNVANNAVVTNSSREATSSATADTASTVVTNNREVLNRDVIREAFYVVTNNNEAITNSNREATSSDVLRSVANNDRSVSSSVAEFMATNSNVERVSDTSRELTREIERATASLPSFAEGGVQDFGKGTLALLHGHEAVVPLGQPLHGKEGDEAQQLVIKNFLHAAAPLSFAAGGAGDFGKGTLAMLHGREVVTPIEKVPQLMAASGNHVTNVANIYIYVTADSEASEESVRRTAKMVAEEMDARLRLSGFGGGYVNQNAFTPAGRR